MSRQLGFRRYRRSVYEAGAVNGPEKGGVNIVGDKILEIVNFLNCHSSINLEVIIMLRTRRR